MTLSGLLMRPRRITQELGRTLRGAAAFLQHLSARQDLDVAFGLLVAESSVAKKGERNDYRLRIANATCAPRSLFVAISLGVANAPERAEDRYAHFTTSLTVRPATSTTLTLRYDWIDEAQFCVDGTVLQSEGPWRGALGMPNLYAVTATLQDTEGRRLDELTVYQTLAE
jgi:hypothetical protein